MHHSRPVFSSLVLAGSIACASGGTPSSGTPAAAVVAPRLQGIFQARGSGLSGEIGISPANRQGEFQVALTLRGSNAGLQHPWHVHSGRCESEGPVVGSILAYPVLEIRGDGNVDLSRRIGVKLEHGQMYYADIHLSRANEAVVACADLQPIG